DHRGESFRARAGWRCSRLRMAHQPYYADAPPPGVDLHTSTGEHDTVGFYPEITDGCKRADSFRSCLATLRRILGLWNRSMYSNTSALAASGVGYVMRWTRSRLSRPKKPSHAAL